MFAANPIARRYGSLIAKNVNRFYETGSNLILTGSGDFSDFQKLRQKMNQRWYKQSVYSGVEEPNVEYYSHFLANECYRMRNKADPYMIDSALGGFDLEGKQRLFCIDQFGTVFEKDYVATGFSNYMNQPLIGKLILGEYLV